MASYTTEILNKLSNTVNANTIYYLTGNSFSLVVYEFSDNEDLVEQYLWTTKSS